VRFFAADQNRSVAIMKQMLLLFVLALGKKHDCSKNKLRNVKELPPLSKHTATIIFLHGLGDDGDGWKQTLKSLQKKFLPFAKFVLPIAPLQPISEYNKQEMVAWFDFKRGIDYQTAKFRCVQESMTMVSTLIFEETGNGLPKKNIFIGGFSQGAAMAIKFAQMNGDTLGGFIALGGFLLSDISRVSSDSFMLGDMFLGHGKDDDRVPVQASEKVATNLRNHGFFVDWHVYPGVGHSSSKEMIRDMKDFLVKRVPKTRELKSIEELQKILEEANREKKFEL